jgi:hypothetical protein
MRWIENVKDAGDMRNARYLVGKLKGKRPLERHRSMKIAVCWVVAPCRAIALMMEAARTSETLVNFYQTTRCYNPEDSNLLTSHHILYCCVWTSPLLWFNVVSRVGVIGSCQGYTVHMLPHSEQTHFGSLLDCENAQSCRSCDALPIL